MWVHSQITQNKRSTTLRCCAFRGLRGLTSDFGDKFRKSVSKPRLSCSTSCGLCRFPNNVLALGEKLALDVGMHTSCSRQKR
jgi:hypothetical protein